MKKKESLCIFGHPYMKMVGRKLSMRKGMNGLTVRENRIKEGLKGRGGGWGSTYKITKANWIKLVTYI